MSIFDSSENLRGQSFAYGLAPFDRVATDSDEFVESDKVSVFVDENGTVNVDETIMLYKNHDPLDAVVEPTFSRDNQFIEGLSKAIPGVPEGGIILYTDGEIEGGTRTLPEGYGFCDGRIYELEDGRTWIAPRFQLITGIGGALGPVYIVKLPRGARYTGKRVPALDLGLQS